MKQQITTPLWKNIQRQSFTDWEALADFLYLDNIQRKSILQHPSFPLLLPRRLAGKISKNTLNDPILRQFLPRIEETTSSEGFCQDPADELPSQITTRLLQKYENRALLLCTKACAMHCRYCFRKHLHTNNNDKDLYEELAFITANTSLKEIILSGGDPLSLSDDKLQALLENLAKIPHIRRIRFHTRFPIGIPERLDHHFLAVLKNTPLQLWFVLHINHPKELDDDIVAALSKVHAMGIPLLNQAVLLRKVNDDAKTLIELNETLINAKIIPYYLHQLDRVEGAAHFEVDRTKGQQLLSKISRQLPGYAIPKYVEEISGQPYKTLVGI